MLTINWKFGETEFKSITTSYFRRIAMSTSVFCLAKSESQASTIVTALRACSIMDRDISVLLADKSGTRDFAHEHHTKAPEGAATGATAGGLVGGVLGLLAGIGALAIPGLGPFIAAGPIMAALSGAALGAGVGGITGALIGLGIPEFEAKRYEGKIRDGAALIGVHCADSAAVKRARECMEKAGATDITSAGEKSVPHTDSDDVPIVETQSPVGRPPAVPFVGYRATPSA